MCSVVQDPFSDKPFDESETTLQDDTNYLRDESFYYTDMRLSELMLCTDTVTTRESNSSIYGGNNRKVEVITGLQMVLKSDKHDME